MRESLGFQKLAVIAPGLLGGSLAMAVRQYIPSLAISLWSRREEPLARARSLGVADTTTTSLKQAVAGADLIVFATPIGVMLPLAEQIVSDIEPGALVTDLGSVKGFVHRTLGRFLTQHGHSFIGSHPMAGSEKQGIEHASFRLFNKARVVLTNDENAPVEQVAQLSRFWSSLGASCVEMCAEDHDRSVARISHLPHALASLCVQSATADGLDSKILALAATGFRDTTRVAQGEPHMWAEILLENSEALQGVLGQCAENLKVLQALVEHRDLEGLEAWLRRASDLRKEFY